MDERPVLRCLVLKAISINGDVYVGRLGLLLANGEREALGCVVPLDEVSYYLERGWMAFLDPVDEAQWNRWNQINTPRQPWNRW